MMSPWVDLEDFDSPSWLADRGGGGRDFITARMCREMAFNYAGSPVDPTASATRCSLHGFPPVLVEAGADEVFRSQIETYVDKLRAAGVDCTYTAGEGGVHAGAMFFSTGAPATTATLDRVLRYMERRWGDAEPRRLAPDTVVEIDVGENGVDPVDEHPDVAAPATEV